MAGERRRLMGELAAWHMAQVVARIPFAPPPPDPAAVNPYREYRPPTAAAAASARWHRRSQFRALVDAWRPKKREG